MRDMNLFLKPFAEEDSTEDLMQDGMACHQAYRIGLIDNIFLTIIVARFRPTPKLRYAPTLCGSDKSQFDGLLWTF